MAPFINKTLDLVTEETFYPPHSRLGMCTIFSGFKIETISFITLESDRYSSDVIDGALI